MKVHGGLLLLILLVLSLFITSINAISSSSSTIDSSGTINFNPTPSGGWLRTEGTYVRDSQGRAVALRTLNFVDWNRINQQLIDNCKARGINCIVVGTRPPETAVPDLPSFSPSNLPQFANTVALMRQNNMYVGMAYIMSTAELSSQWGINGPAAVANHVINFWTPIISYFTNEPTFACLVPLDEPNFDVAGERQLWATILPALRQANPNLLWVARLIVYLRFTNGMWSSINDVPVPNVILAGSVCLNELNPYFDPMDDPDPYAAADTTLAEIISRMQSFQNNVPIPISTWSGISTGYPTNNARGYLIREIARAHETRRWLTSFWGSQYQWPDNAAAMLAEVMQDTPYPNYW